MLWKCSKGHEWSAKFHSVLYDKTWCPRCFSNDRRGKSRLVGIDKVKERASVLGFEVMGTDYKNSYSPLEMRHSCGMEIKATYHRLTHGLACPQCSLRPRGDEGDAHAWAERFGGILVGFAPRSKDRSIWRCACGHEWRSTWSYVKRGGWCPFCRGKRSVSDVHRSAVAKLYQHRRYDAKKGLETTLTVEDMILALEQDCVYCGNRASNVDRKDSNVGHVVENCVPCCGRCNLVKNSLVSFEAMLEVGRILRKYDP